MSTNILVVEDRSDWRDILSTTLEQEGHHTHQAASYQEAVAALAQSKFSLAVIDPVLDMTNRFNRDGLSVIQKICEIQPLMPVIIITGSLTHDMEVSIQHLYPEAPVLFKESWDSTEFNDLVDNLLGQQGRAGSDTADRRSTLATRF